MNKKVKFSDFIGGDLALWIATIFLCVASILVISSSTLSLAYKNLDGDTVFYFKRQITYVTLALSITFIVHRYISYKFYFKYATVIFYLSLIPLLLTFTSSGDEYNNASRWIGIGFGNSSRTIQPSDFIKISLIIILAKRLATRQRTMKNSRLLPSLNPSKWKNDNGRNKEIFTKTTLPLLFPIFICCFLILLTNLSTAGIICISSLVVLHTGRVKGSEIFKLLAIILVFLALTITVLKITGKGRADTWISRVESFFSPTDISKLNSAELSSDEFQKFQARIAVASGGITGVGAGKSTQRANLPHPYSDYAYAFIIEEYGTLGGIIVLILYLWIFERAIVIFKKSKTGFPAMLVIGLNLMITIQAMLHMAVSVNLIPVTGQTLPIISLGGSSLVATCLSIGIVLGVSRELNQEIKNDELAKQREELTEDWGDQPMIDNEELSEENTWGESLIEEEQDLLENNNITTSENIDMILQQNRLNRALNEEIYQHSIIYKPIELNDDDEEDKDNS